MVENSKRIHQQNLESKVRQTQNRDFLIEQMRDLEK
jgi:hypothetical protein